jgi:hypothetical protein
MRLRTLSVGLIAAIAVVLGAGTALAAEPEFVTKAAVGQTAGAVPFAGTTGLAILEGKAGNGKIICYGDGSVSGEATGPKTLSDVVIVMTRCEGSFEVTTPGYPMGTVVTKPLTGVLGTVSPGVPGIKLFSEAEGRDGIVSEADEAGESIPLKFRGELTGTITGASGESVASAKLPSSLKLTFAEKKGVQKVLGFSEGPEAGLLGQWEFDVFGGSFEPTALSEVQTLASAPLAAQLGVTK